MGKLGLVGWFGFGDLGSGILVRWVKWDEFGWMFSEFSVADDFRALAILEEKLYQ